MWFTKIRRRKTQFIIIGLLTMMATAILSSCVSFTIETKQFVKQYYDYKNSPMYFCVVGRDDMENILLEDEKCAALIGKIETGNAKYVADDFYINGEKKKGVANEGNFFYALEDMDTFPCQLNIVEGEQEKAPKDGEIWLTHTFAKANDIHAGDTMKIGAGDTYQVSAIVNSQLSSSGFIDSYPFYLNEKELKNIDGTVGYSCEIFAKNGDITQKDFEEALPQEFTDSKMYMLSSDTLNMCLSILTVIFGGVGIAASLVIMVVSIVVFRYLIRATIAKEYQMIGIYKAMGKENEEIKKIYLYAYMLCGVIGMIPGVFLARPLTRYLSYAVLGGVKGFHLTWYSTLTGIGAVLLLTLVLYLNITAELRKVCKVSVLDAINLQSLSSTEKRYKSVIKNAHSPLSMAVNDICKRSGMSILIILILTVSVYMDLLAMSVGLTLSNYSKDREIWENLPPYNCVVKIMEDENSVSSIKDSEYVSDYVEVEMEPYCPDMEIEGTEWTADQAHPMIYDNFTEDRYEKVPFTKGRICLERGELTASEQFLTEIGKTVGDYIEIGTKDKKKHFLIVGSYSAMMKGGTSFYLQGEDYQEIGYEPVYDTVLVFLKDAKDYDAFIEELHKNAPKSHAYTDFNFVEQEGDTVSEIANPICMVLIIAFSAFSILNIINLIHTLNKENRRKYGILKAMGFTTGYILLENLFSLTIEYAGAVVITVVLHQFLSPIIFSMACGINYIYKPVWLTIVVCVLMYFVIMAIALGMLQGIKRIKPVELMEE